MTICLIEEKSSKKEGNVYKAEFEVDVGFVTAFGQPVLALLFLVSFRNRLDAYESLRGW